MQQAYQQLSELLTLSVVDAAQAFIGWRLAHNETSGIIVETEAYHQSEPACHASVGKTARTETLFYPPGCAYVYLSYGLHRLVNIVVEPEGVGAAVLIRALEPVTGVDVMCERRYTEKVEALCSGPGKLTQALDIDLHHNSVSFLSSDLRLLPPAEGWETPQIVSGKRIGISKAVERPWRFAVANNRHVSKPRL